VFAKRIPLRDHLARHRLGGLFLDTLPYNAHTTASDALWAGLPVLTCTGETFAGKLGTSLNAINLPKLITTTLEDYERIAIELATDPGKLAEIEQKLADNRLTNTAIRYKAVHQTYRGSLHHNVRARAGWSTARSFFCCELSPCFWRARAMLLL
jgi:predicted O-linked N-acetylglucosamine transferase (SPINDLY family)